MRTWVIVLLMLMILLSGCDLEDEDFNPIFHDYTDTSYLNENESTANMTQVTQVNVSEEENGTINE